MNMTTDMIAKAGGAMDRIEASLEQFIDGEPATPATWDAWAECGIVRRLIQMCKKQVGDLDERRP